MSGRIPPLAEREKPGLSETLTCSRQPDRCQSCDRQKDADALQRWVECDAWDKPTKVIVVLCATCAKRLVGAHPRLYRQLEHFAPWPGVMPLCVHCRHRDSLRCCHADLKANGGPGLGIRYPSPMTACGSHGCEHVYPGPVSSCEGREVLGLVAQKTQVEMSL